MQRVRFTSFEEVLGDLEARRAQLTPAAARAIAHCAQSIEYSLRGYPRLRSPIFRATVGRFAKWHFLRKGYVEHDTAAEIPGAPAPAEEPDVDAAVERLRRAIEDFRRFDGRPGTHFAYGELTKDEYEKIHAMHIADHLDDV